MDTFHLSVSEFGAGTVSGCGVSRNYTLSLKKTAAVYMNLVVLGRRPAAQAGIRIDEGYCGYNIDRGIGGSNGHVSTSCSEIMEPGDFVINLCMTASAISASGSVLVQYIE